MKTFLLTIFALLFSQAQCFVTPKSTSSITNTFQQQQQQYSTSSSTTTTSLNERQWNFNEGRSPFGLKHNAEIWNGRVAQMCFTIVLIQELVTGQGVIQGIQEGNIFNMIMVGFTGVSILALSGFLALKGKQEFVTKE